MTMGLLGAGIALGGIGALGAGLLGATSSSPWNAESLSPEAKKARDAETANAAKFQANLPGYQQNLYNQSENQSRNAMAQKLAGVRSAANSRGLLYSGLRQGAEADVGAQSANDLANRRANINQSSQDISNQMSQTATKRGLDMLNAQQQMADYNQKMAQQDYERKQKGMSDMMSGAGGLIGALI